jgi:hypothetical protein
MGEREREEKREGREIEYDVWTPPAGSWYRGWMGAGEMSLEERILMSRPFIHPLKGLLIKILLSKLIYPTHIHPLYHLLSTVEPTCQFI